MNYTPESFEEAFHEKRAIYHGDNERYDFFRGFGEFLITAALYHFEEEGGEPLTIMALMSQYYDQNQHPSYWVNVRFNDGDLEEFLEDLEIVGELQ